MGRSCDCARKRGAGVLSLWRAGLVSGHDPAGCKRAGEPLAADPFPWNMLHLGKKLEISSFFAFFLPTDVRLAGSPAGLEGFFFPNCGRRTTSTRNLLHNKAISIVTSTPPALHFCCFFRIIYRVALWAFVRRHVDLSYLHWKVLIPLPSCHVYFKTYFLQDPTRQPYIWALSNHCWYVILECFAVSRIAACYSATLATYGLDQ